MANKQKDQKHEEKTAISLRFVNEVERQFTAEMGNKLQFTDYEKTLAQHLFLKVDSALREFEDKRLASNQKKTPYTWGNVNMRKLAIDAVHRIALGLDALLPNHIHPIPYYNSKLKKYDLDLRIGYEGKDYYRREMAVEKPIDIIYELVHETDTFKPIKKSFENEVESYIFEINNPFDRGPIVGGFGYIMYEDPRKNKLVIVTNDDFKKAEQHAQSDAFWSKHPEKMKYKTLVHRTTEKLQLDPKKVNAKSYAYVEGQEDEAFVQQEIAENANSEFIDVEAKVADEPEPEQLQEEPKEDTKELEEKTKSKQKEDKPEKKEPKQEKLAMEGPGF